MEKWLGSSTNDSFEFGSTLNSNWKNFVIVCSSYLGSRFCYHRLSVLSQKQILLCVGIRDSKYKVGGAGGLFRYFFV